MGKLNIVPQSDLTFDLLRKLAKKSKFTEEIKILDLGCGEKPYESYIRKLFSKNKVSYVGVDFNSRKADYNLDLNEKELPFENGEFDIVICTEVLEHIYNIEKVIFEMTRVLSSKGFMLITAPLMFPVHEKEFDFYRYTFHFYRKKFGNYKIIKESISNTFLSYPIYVLNYYLVNMFSFGGVSYSLVKYIQKPFDLIALIFFRKKIITYSYYINYGVLFTKWNPK